MFYALLYLLHVFPIVPIELTVAAGVPSWPKMAEASTAAWEKTPASASRLAIAQWSDRPVGAVHPYWNAHSSNLDGRLKMPSACQIASSSRSFLGIAMWNCSLQSIAKLLANIDMFFNACGGTPSPRETLDFSSLQKQPAKLSGWQWLRSGHRTSEGLHSCKWFRVTLYQGDAECRDICSLL
jgi:hypothetical protein